MKPFAFIVTCLILLATLGAGHAQTAAAPAGDGGWPKQIPGASPLFLYQPQVDSWNNNKLGGHAAVRVASTPPAYGVVWFNAQTENMKDGRMVILFNITVNKAEFPGSKGKGAAYQKQIQQAYSGKVSTIALDRLQTSLIAAGVTPPVQQPVAVQNNAPTVVVSNVPAMMIRVYGAPVLNAVAGGKAQRVVNTPALIVTDGSTFYLYLTNRWLQASSLTGTYSPVASPPAFLATALSAAKSAKNADLFPDPGKSLKDMLAANKLPSIYVTTSPTELIVTQGKPSLQGVAGTSLQMVTNTKSDLFFDTQNNTWYLLAAGRWFSASDLGGSWAYVPGAQLPADFAKIPTSNPHAAVLVSVPGTPEAKEAVIAASIPQTATINRAAAKFTAFYAGGTPNFQPVTGTTVQYAVNSAVPVLKVGNAYYALDSGVWFQASMPSGPWWVATSVPAAVYQIPPSSPLYNVTYVKVYGSTPDVVYCGYTPGYYGTIVGTDGTVVYGTGYDYAPYVNDTWFVAPPVTYGPAASYFWGAASGYVLGAATSALWGPGWGYGWNDFVTPYWGVYGTPVWASGVVPGAWGGAWSASSDAYRQWGNAAYRGVTGSYANAWTGNYGNVNRGVAYNSRNGAYTAGTRVSNTNAYTGVHSTAAQGVHYNPTTGNTTAARGGTVTNPYTGKTSGAVHGDTYHAATGNTSSWGAAKVGNNYYASRDGNVYHANGDNWTHPDGARYTGGAGYLDGQAGARAAATDRWNDFSRAGGFDNRFGGGFRSGGAWGGGFRAGGFRR